MPPKPKGDRAMTGAERLRAFRERQRQANPPQSDREKLKAVLARVRELEAALASSPASKAAKARADKSFEAAVNAEVRRRIDAADDYTRKQLKECNAQLLQFQIERGKRGVFSKRQFKQLQILCHPDNSASKELRAELLQVLVKHEAHLVNPEKK